MPVSWRSPAAPNARLAAMLATTRSRRGNRSAVGPFLPVSRIRRGCNRRRIARLVGLKLACVSRDRPGDILGEVLAQSDHSARSTMPTVRDVTAARSEGLQLLVVGTDGAYFASHAIPPVGQIALGRADDRDVRIQDPSISRTHAIVHLGRELFIEDCGSRHGTRARGQKLAPGDLVAISLGEAITLGTVTIIVQRRTGRARSWRLWSHSFFEGRLEEECARAERYERSFALIHVLFDPSTDRAVALAAIENATNPGDVIADYGPLQYELLLVEAERADAEHVIKTLCGGDGTIRAGLACYPRDGRDPHTLSQHARSRARGTAPSDETKESFVTAGDAAMRDLRDLVARIARSEISILLLGETGVGKEVFARTIHRESKRSGGPFVAVNCGALAGDLIESELFGHKKGAFTGAMQDKVGLLESAEGGTVFLDEIGELASGMQVKLLRVLQEREVRRIGETKPRPIDVRLVCATNRDLEAEIERGEFRQDLYFRINGFSLVIPPLRERVAEIEPLARHFIASSCATHGRFPEPVLAPAALELLTRYHWPGNIRELRNVMDRAVVLCNKDVIEPQHLPGDKMAVLATAASETEAQPAVPGRPTTASATTEAQVAPAPPASPASVFSPDARGEIEAIKQALDKSAGNQTEAARILGISRRTLINRLDRYGLPRPRKGR